MRIEWDLKDADDIRTIEALRGMLQVQLQRIEGETDADYATRVVEKFTDDVLAAYIAQPVQQLQAVKSVEAAAEIDARLKRRALASPAIAEKSPIIAEE